MTSSLRRSLVRLAGVWLTCASLCLAAGPAWAAAPPGDGAAQTTLGQPGTTGSAAGAGAAQTTLGQPGITGSAAGAGTADLEVSVTGTTLAATTTGKDANVTIVNHGPASATGIVVAFDLGDLVTEKVAFEVPGPDACRAQADVVSCDVIDLDSGQALDLGVRLTRKGGTGDAGTLTATVSHDGVDDDAASDTVTVAVAVAGSGPDLFVYAPDVPFDPDTNRTGAVTPGGTAKLRYAVGNVGDGAVAGVRLVIQLPRQVTFAETEPGCVYDRTNSRATCVYERMPIVPADADTDDSDRVYSMISFYTVVTVAAGAPAPARLRGGEVSVEPLVDSASVPAGARHTAVPSLPGNAVGGSASRLAEQPPAGDDPEPGTGDVDVTDNTDEFVVYVVARAVPATPATPGGAAGGLPITGSRPARTGAVGLAAVVVGAVLLLAGRRRRPAPVPLSDGAAGGLATGRTGEDHTGLIR